MTPETYSSPTNTPTETAPIDREWLTVNGFNRLWREDAAFRDFARQVYNYLETMRPGRSVTFARYSGEKLEWCVRTASAFLCESIHRTGWYMGNDYMTVHRCADFPVPPKAQEDKPRCQDAVCAVRRHPGIHVGLNTRIPY